MHLETKDKQKLEKEINKYDQNYKPILNISIKEYNNKDMNNEPNFPKNAYFNIKNKIHLKKIFLNILALINLLIGRYLYFLSLKGCAKTEYDCLFNIQYIIDDINNCVQSTFYFIITLFLIQMKLCSKYYTILIFVIFIEFIITDHGNNFLNHGISL